MVRRQAERSASPDRPAPQSRSVDANPGEQLRGGHFQRATLGREALSSLFNFEHYTPLDVSFQ